MHRTILRFLGLTLAMTLVLAGSLAAAPQRSVASATNLDTAFYWNDVLLEAFEREGGGPGPLARAGAMMHVGIYDALNSVEWSSRGGVGIGYSEYRVLAQVDHTSIDADLAAGLTARALLSNALPDQQSFVEQKFTERHGSASNSESSLLAQAVAGSIIFARNNDGADDTTPYTFDNVPGAWQLTGHMCSDPFDDPVTPNWGNVTPFALTSGSQFRRPLPGGHTSYQNLLASSLYANQLIEVASLGRYDSTARTSEQTEIAWFWANDLDGTYKPPGQLLEHARIVAEDSMLDGLDAARLFAHVSLSLADAGIAAWDQKYLTPVDLWRPETAIKLATTDGNAATDPYEDSDWEPLSADESDVRFNPCFPAWVSGHATFAAAWAGAMQFHFGDNVTFTATTGDPHAVGVTRTFTKLSDAAEENARSRIYLGVHFQFDADDGLATGYNVAGHVTSNYLTQQWCQEQCTVYYW